MEEQKENIVEEKEIGLFALANKLWQNKKFILKVMGIGAVIGLIIAFSIPKEYTTTVVLMPEAQSASGGTMGSLAALAGINLGNTSGMDALASPDLYPSVFQSTPFLKGLFDINVKDSEQKIDTTLYAYLNEYQKVAWWSPILKSPLLLFSLFSSEEDDNIGQILDNRRVLSKEELDVIGILKEQITIFSEKKTGITTIEVSMQSPEISAYLADTLTSYFQSYIIDYRTRKARKDLEFAEKLYTDSKDDYHHAQQQLAAFVDGNLNVISAKYRITQDRLQNEASLAYQGYIQTAQQLQMARVKVQDNTPVFTVIQPAIQPFKPSKPNKKIILIEFLFLAFIISGCWVLRDDLKEMIVRNNSTIENKS